MKSLVAFFMAAALSVPAADMFPFVISYDLPAGTAVDMSHLIEAPAGKSGRIRVKDGHFVNDKGRVRLNATNLTGPANFPQHNEAERLARRLARLGVNCVRLHYFDSFYGTFMLEQQQGIIADDFRTVCRLDPVQRDLQDYLIAQFKKNGIYVDINLHVARTLDAADGFAPGTPWANKGVDQFDPRIIEKEKEYARELLCHVNPYTKMSYLEDPVVALVELNNEDALWNVYLGGAIDGISQPYATVFKNLWNDWLCRKYGTAEKMLEAWKIKNVPLGEEIVTEGAFDSPVSVDGKRWALDKGTAEVKVGAEGGALRVAVTRKGDEYFPKLYRRVDVTKGVPYTVSFKIRRVSGGAGEVGFAMADRRNGWAPLGVLTHFTPGTGWTSQKFSFVAPDTVKNAEIQFTRFTSEGVYEIDDLSFKTGAEFTEITNKDPNKGEVPIVKSRGSAHVAVTADFFQFLVDTERAYWTGMQKYLQQDLGLKAPVSATQLGYSPPHVQADMDIVDIHAYWCHPTINKAWQIHNIPMVNSFGGCVAWMAASRVAGKPYIVSEYNHPYPIFYGAEGQPMLRAYGAFQGWDGVFEYSYNNRRNAEPDHNEYFFSIAARTDVLAHFPACAALFLRDVKESPNRLTVNLPYGKYFDSLVSTRSVSQGIGSAGLPASQSLLQAVDVNLNPTTDEVSVGKRLPTPKDGVYVSDTGELTWNNADRKAGFFTVNTPNTKLFSGFHKDTRYALGDVAVTFGKSRLGWATLSLVSRNATGFGGAGAAEILLTATGLSHNGGAKFTDHGNNHISCRDEDWGHGATVNEGINATVELVAAPARVECWALNERGEPAQKVAVSAGANGGSQIVIGEQYKTVWYKISVK